jgi:hypothetical protein
VGLTSRMCVICVLSFVFALVMEARGKERDVAVSQCEAPDRFVSSNLRTGSDLEH